MTEFDGIYEGWYNMAERKFKLLKQYISSEPLVKACMDVADLCNRLDNMQHTFFVEDNFEQEHTLPWLYCAVCGDEIAGFISIYKFDNKTAEICAFVLPRYRRIHLFSRLLNKVCTDYADYTFQCAISSDNDTSRKVLRNTGFDYVATECLMTIQPEDFFPLSKPEGVSWNLLKDAVIFTYVVDNVTIGQCSAQIQNKRVAIHDVTIEPAYRGQGYGYRLMCYALDSLLKAYGPVSLHVTKENAPAYNLYKKLGFKSIQEVEYYEI